MPAGEAAAATIDVPCGDNAALIRAIDVANSAGRPTSINLGSGLGRCVFVLTAPAVPNDHNGLPVITGDITINGGKPITFLIGFAAFNPLTYSQGNFGSVSDIPKEKSGTIAESDR